MASPRPRGPGSRRASRRRLLPAPSLRIRASSTRLWRHPACPQGLPPAPVPHLRGLGPHPQGCGGIHPVLKAFLLPRLPTNFTQPKPGLFVASPQHSPLQPAGPGQGEAGSSAKRAPITFPLPQFLIFEASSLNVKAVEASSPSLRPSSCPSSPPSSSCPSSPSARPRASS